MPRGDGGPPARFAAGAPARQTDHVSSRLRRILIIVAIVAGGTILGRLLGYNFGGNTVVRCRKGHLFSTIWIPGVKLKALDLGIARVQRCPVGKHWSLVVPVKDSTLSKDERRFAAKHHDVRIP
jgi:hypothetical protein